MLEGHTQGDIHFFYTLPPMPWSPWHPLLGDGDHSRGESFDQQERWGVSAEPTGLCSSSSAQLSVEGNLIVHFQENFFQVREMKEKGWMNGNSFSDQTLQILTGKHQQESQIKEQACWKGIRRTKSLAFIPPLWWMCLLIKPRLASSMAVKKNIL